MADTRRRSSEDAEAPRRVTRRVLRAMPLPRHADDEHKDDRGRVLIVAGAPEMPGAAVLAAVASLRAGAGRLRIATCRSIAPWVGAAVPESRVFALDETREGGIDPSSASRVVELAEKVDAVLVGPGLIDYEAVARLVARVLPDLACPVVLDAA